MARFTGASGLRLVSTAILGGASDNIARLKPAGNHTVANNATLNLGAPRGFVFVQNTSDQHGALYYLRGTTAIELLDSNNVFSPTQGTASSNNIYHDGSVWRLENTRGSSKTYEVIILGRSTDF
jgi:hemin uptake protein HemP